MSNKKTNSGSCFCGAVQFMVSGDPEAISYSAKHSKRRYLIQNLESPFAQYIASIKDRLNMVQHTKQKGGLLCS